MAADSNAKRRIDYAVKLMRYKRAVEQSRMPANRKRLAVQHYAEAMAMERRLTDACRQVYESRRVVRPGHRRALSTLVRGLVGIVRHEPREHWPALAAESAAHRVFQGLDPGLVWDCLAACWPVMCNAPGATAPEEMSERFQALVRQFRSGVKQDRAADAPEGKKSKSSGNGRGVLVTGLSDLNSQTIEEKTQERHAVEELRQALREFKPWARRVVIGRMTRELTDAELASEQGLPVALVHDVIDVARKTVHRYTTYYDSDTWWEAREDKDEG